jgi:hypothetical protein
VTIILGRARVALLALPLLFASARASGADAPATQCESAYEKAQLLRQRGKLLAARDQALACAREQCPEVARKDCARWADEIGHEIPSVVVVVRDETDHDVPGHRLLVDGAPHAEMSSGRAFDLDPGAHVFRVERANGPAVEQSFTVYQGERDRLLRIVSPSAPVAAPPTTTPIATTSPAPSPRAEHRSYAPAAIVTGVAVASFGVSAFLGLTGRHDLSELRSSCAPTCSDAQVDPVRTRLMVSDVTLGVGLVGATVAAVLFAHAASAPSPTSSAHFEIAPVRDGAAVLFGSRF